MQKENTNNATWRWNMKRGLSEERKARVVKIARDIYAKRFGVPAPKEFNECPTSNSIVLVFALPEERPLGTLPLFNQV